MTGRVVVEAHEGRFDRQERITWWDQDRLRRARVVVVGAGALGNEIVKNLVLVGVGRVLVVDPDTVERSNLSRGVFLRPGDEGRPKAMVVAERATAVSPASTVHGAVRDIASFGAGLGRRADVLVAGLDNREARLRVNRLAWRAGRCWVDGAIEGLAGVARVFGPPGACYECTLTAADHEDLDRRRSCRLLSTAELARGRVPTTATTASIVAGHQTQEVVKLLHRDRPEVTPLRGAIVVDGQNNDAYPLTYPVDPDCPAHETVTDPFVVEADATTTVADLVAGVGWEAGRIDLPDDHLVGWSCPGCGREGPGRGRLAEVVAAAARCPHCAGVRKPRVVASVAVPSGGPPARLVDLGLAPDEVLGVRRGGDQRHVWARAADPDLPPGW